MRVLLVVDVQNDFVTGSLAVSRAAEIIPAVNERAERFRANGDLVVFSQDWHPDVTPHFDEWPAHCVAGTDGARLHAGLKIDPSDLIVKKGLGDRAGYSLFEGAVNGTPVVQWLHDVGAEELHVCGLATDHCVAQTVLDARRFGFTTFVLLDACRAVNVHLGDERDAIARMQEAGAIVLAGAG